MILADATTVVYSATDLAAASTCEWALMRRLDWMLGRAPEPPTVEDDMLIRTGLLGDAHEKRVLDELKRSRKVVEIERPSFDDIESAAKQTLDALRDDSVDVVYQAAFFDGRFLGYADFIMRGDDGRFEVYDTKLARKAKITALLQLAAYSDQLTKLGIPIGEQVSLWLGTGELSTHKLSDILPVYRKRRARLQEIIDGRIADDGVDAHDADKAHDANGSNEANDANGSNEANDANNANRSNEATEWGDPRYTACGRCAACEEQVQSTRDVLLVAGMRLTQRAKLTASGVYTIDELAARTAHVDGLSDATLAALRQQASIQLSPTSPAEPLAWRVNNPATLAALPHPSPGDIFFDFEGDPLHKEHNTWGLDYLFGLVEPDDTFVAFWADDLPHERQALIDFLDYVRQRLAAYPDMHIYHYASYERSHLLTLAARHGVGEEEVDDLLRNHVLVDLYPIVRQGLRIGSRSYSLKKLEPLYMGEHERSGVANAADSITEYVRYTELLAAGDLAGAAAVRTDIERYNTYDCVSTSRLRDWLLRRAEEQHVGLAGTADLTLDLPVPLRPPDPVYLELQASLDGIPPADRTPDETALALASAAIDYHRRENKSFWWEHYFRLSNPVAEWADTRGVFVIDRSEVVRDWSLAGKDRTLSRTLAVTGAAAPGSKFSSSESHFVIYDPPPPPFDRAPQPGARSAHDRVTFRESDTGRYLLTEKLTKGADTYAEHPIAVAPGSPPGSKVLADAISEWGRQVLDELPAMRPDAALDLLRRTPPRLPELVRGDSATAIRDSLLSLDRSYIAVQGPPGTGKTTVGARVIADLVSNHGWKVGVVAQSHATVENMLRALIEKAGLDPALVGKPAKSGPQQAAPPWTGNPVAGLRSPGGFVIGGTAWTFANANTVPRASLDLLVIDEAGQFSLANTIAAAVSAKRLLLLGDPQQLPQVSQGTHPEPVDVSALGWLSMGHDVLPAEFGYFLETSWRMHPALCAPVSALSYEGRLHAHASDRSLEGIDPGLHTVPTAHHGNSTSSPEEAAAVVARVSDLIGRPWTSQGETHPLTESDLIVVAPYNAQVELIHTALAAAGFPAVPVGTVDKFQGQEAAVAIVSLAASAADDVPRGLEFLLLANRLNVAISRAQWAAYLVYSPALTDHLPGSPAALAQLSAFIRLVEPETNS
ncbi:MAG: helicase [Subtercola sp.]|nr:helicase [Subtercola sp.]